MGSLRIIIIILIISCGIYFFFEKSVEKTEKNNTTSRVISQQLPIPVLKKNKRVEKKISRPALNVSTSDKQELLSFSMKKIKFMPSSISLIEGVFASREQLIGMRHITRILDFFVYSGIYPGKMSVVYSSENKKMGIFTGEVSVKGRYDDMLLILEKYGVEILFRSEMTEEVVFYLEDFNNMAILEEINVIKGAKILFDLKFSKFKKI